MDVPFSYVGDKSKIAEEIISLFPEHDYYCEPFMGCLHVLLRKERKFFEVANDFDGKIVNFFRCLQDKEKYSLMLDWLDKAPYSRQLYFDLVREIEDLSLPDWQRGAYWYYILRISFGGRYNKFGYGYDQNIFFEKLIDSLPKLEAIHRRLQGVLFENRDYKFILKNYQKAGMLFYCDPPYIHDTREKGSCDIYSNEMSNKNHEELVDLFLSMKNQMIVLSGYESPLYTPLLQAGWVKKEIETYSALQQVTKTAKTKIRGRRIETLYFSPEAQKPRSTETNITAGVICMKKKLCIRCNNLLPITDFYKNAHHESRRNVCRSCQNQYHLNYSRKNKNFINEKNRYYKRKRKELKLCVQCLQWKHKSLFMQSRINPDGYTHECRECLCDNKAGKGTK